MCPNPSLMTPSTASRCYFPQAGEGTGDQGTQHKHQLFWPVGDENQIPCCMCKTGTSRRACHRKTIASMAAPATVTPCQAVSSRSNMNKRCHITELNYSAQRVKGENGALKPSCVPTPNVMIWKRTPLTMLAAARRLPPREMA